MLRLCLASTSARGSDFFFNEQGHRGLSKVRVKAFGACVHALPPSQVCNCDDCHQAADDAQALAPGLYCNRLYKDDPFQHHGLYYIGCIRDDPFPLAPKVCNRIQCVQLTILIMGIVQREIWLYRRRPFPISTKGVHVCN